MVPAAGHPVVGVDVVAVFEYGLGREEARGTTLFDNGPYRAGTPLAVPAFPGVELGVNGKGVLDYLGGFGPPVSENVVARVGM